MSATRRPTWRDDGIPLGWQQVVTFLAGLGAFLWEVIVEDSPSWIIVSASLGMLGLPSAIKADRIRRATTEEDA